MRSVDLGEAVVRATKIKVKMRGDTLVYDATAFNLPQGSMLQNLIEQMPGARMTDEGEIFINGRKIDETNAANASGLLASEFNYYINSVAQGFTYNQETGAYTFRPENVKGN